jgi:Gas vesicle synthesis protein GvpL/GvpF
MIYVYAITDPLDLEVGASGLEDAPLELVEQGGIAGVFSTHDQLEIKPDPDLLWAHERVIDHLLERAAVLPLRFGTVLEGPEALRTVLGEDEARFRLLLSRVRGCVELAVRVGLEPSPAQAASGGTDYMRQRLAARERENEAADRVLAPLRPLARATARRPVQEGTATVSESYLVPRAAVEPFAAELKALQAQNPGLSISCTGPWGPYSFVQGAKG